MKVITCVSYETSTGISHSCSMLNQGHDHVKLLFVSGIDGRIYRCCKLAMLHISTGGSSPNIPSMPGAIN